MAIQDDFSISASGDIRYTGSTANYTVIQLHRWLGTLMDDAAASGNDILDITDATASERSTDNIITLLAPYNIDDTAAQHLYDGSVIQKGGDEIYDGVLVFAASGMYLEVVQNGAIVTPNFWTNGLNADAANGISHRFLVKTRTAGADIDGKRLIGQTREFGYTYSEFRINGTSRGNNVMALTYATDLNNQTAEGTVSGWTTITNTEGYQGIDVNNDSTQEYYYSKWNRDTYSINQFYERMKWLTRRGSASTIYGLNGALFRGITHEVSLTTPRSGTFSAVESVSWGSGATAGTGKMVAIDSTTAGTKMWIQLVTGVAPSASVTITGTTSAATATNTGTPTERTLSFPFCGASTGSALIGSYGFSLESTDLSANDKVFDLTNTQRTPPNYVTFTVSGLISGEDRVLVAPLGYLLNYDTEVGAFTDNETLTFGNGATAKLLELTDNGTTGSMIIRLLTGSVPPDNNSITGGSSSATAQVNGSIVGTIDIEQLTLNGALSGATVTSVVVSEAIPSDTPATGTIRIKRANGVYSTHPYSAWSGSTFTITSHDFSSNNAANGTGVYISYIDKLADASTASFTGVYSANRNLFVRVRDGGVSPIKTFETTAVLGSAGGSSTAIRTSDA
jgi:hypothetical protein